jgi:hypothetical protein
MTEEIERHLIDCVGGSVQCVGVKRSGRFLIGCVYVQFSVYGSVYVCFTCSVGRWWWWIDSNRL